MLRKLISLLVFFAAAASYAAESRVEADYYVFRVAGGEVSLDSRQRVRARLTPQAPDSRFTLLLRDGSGSIRFEGKVPEGAFLRGEAVAADGTFRRIETSGGEGAFAVVLPAVDEGVIEVHDRLTAKSMRAEVGAFSALTQRRSVASLATGGDSDNRLDVLLIGDGYTADQASRFAEDAERIAADLFSIEPYRTYRAMMNVTTLFVESAESGADHPPFVNGCTSASCCADPDMRHDPQEGKMVSTALDSSFCGYNLHRLLVVDVGKVLRVAAAQPEWDQILVIVNDGTYGGAGYSVNLGTTSTNMYAVDIARHELGHSIVGLADEYEYGGSEIFPGCDRAGDARVCEANVTSETNPALIKWRAWIEATTPLPTPDVFENNELVGAFEGASYSRYGVFRPKRNCLMRTLGQPFCPICVQEFVRVLWQGPLRNHPEGLDPIGEASPEQQAPFSIPIGGSQAFRVSLLQPLGETLRAHWSVDGVPVGGGSEFLFQATAGGQHVVRVEVVDETASVRLRGAGFSSAREWRVNVTGGGRRRPVKR